MVNLFLIIHITFGLIGLISGTINIVGKKGGKKHRLIGSVFVASMIISGISSVVISTSKQLNFLFLVGIFTLYMTLSGYLYIRRKYHHKLIKSLAIMMILFGGFLAYQGIRLLINAHYFGIVNISFAFIGIMFSIKDVFRPISDFVSRKNRHVQRIVGAYIAAVTAFLVVNIKLPAEIPGFILWLLPSLILTPFIIQWTKNKK